MRAIFGVCAKAGPSAAKLAPVHPTAEAPARAQRAFRRVASMQASKAFPNPAPNANLQSR
jgi:hypothetical protein